MLPWLLCCGEVVFCWAVQDRWPLKSTVQRLSLKWCQILHGMRRFTQKHQVIHELRSEFERYERALCSNDVQERCWNTISCSWHFEYIFYILWANDFFQELDQLFQQSQETVRYGVSENLYGYEARFWWDEKHFDNQTNSVSAKRIQWVTVCSRQRPDVKGIGIWKPTLGQSHLHHWDDAKMLE